MKSLSSLLPFIVIIGLFWLLFIRPQMRRQREARDLQTNIKPGDHVLLTSGIYATVASIDTDFLMVEVADGVEVKLDRRAISHVLPPEVVEADAPETEPDTQAHTDVVTESDESDLAEEKDE